MHQRIGAVSTKIGQKPAGKPSAIETVEKQIDNLKKLVSSSSNESLETKLTSLSKVMNEKHDITGRTLADAVEQINLKIETSELNITELYRLMVDVDFEDPLTEDSIQSIVSEVTSSKQTILTILANLVDGPVDESNLKATIDTLHERVKQIKNNDLFSRFKVTNSTSTINGRLDKVNKILNTNTALLWETFMDKKMSQGKHFESQVQAVIDQTEAAVGSITQLVGSPSSKSIANQLNETKKFVENANSAKDSLVEYITDTIGGSVDQTSSLTLVVNRLQACVDEKIENMNEEIENTNKNAKELFKTFNLVANDKSVADQLATCNSEMKTVFGMMKTLNGHIGLSRQNGLLSEQLKLCKKEMSLFVDKMGDLNSHLRSTRSSGSISTQLAACVTEIQTLSQTINSVTKQMGSSPTSNKLADTVTECKNQIETLSTKMNALYGACGFSGDNVSITAQLAACASCIEAIKGIKSVDSASFELENLTGLNGHTNSPIFSSELKQQVVTITKTTDDLYLACGGGSQQSITAQLAACRSCIRGIQGITTLTEMANLNANGKIKFKFSSNLMNEVQQAPTAIEWLDEMFGDQKWMTNLQASRDELAKLFNILWTGSASGKQGYENNALKFDYGNGTTTFNETTLDGMLDKVDKSNFSAQLSPTKLKAVVSNLDLIRIALKSEISPDFHMDDDDLRNCGAFFAFAHIDGSGKSANFKEFLKLEKAN